MSSVWANRKHIQPCLSKSQYCASQSPCYLCFSIIWAELTSPADLKVMYSCTAFSKDDADGTLLFRGWISFQYTTIIQRNKIALIQEYCFV